MKRLVPLLGILVLVGAIAVPVWAHGPGWGRGYHTGCQDDWLGYGPGPGYGTLTEEQRTQLDKLHKSFYDETAQLRDEIRGKSRELNTALDSPNPDTEKAKALQNEISDLQANLAQERLNLRLEARKIVPEARFGRGYGRDYGHPRRGYGPGHCWK